MWIGSSNRSGTRKASARDSRDKTRKPSSARAVPARDELGFVPATSLSEGLRAEYEWVRRRVEAEPEKALRKAG